MLARRAGLGTRVDGAWYCSTGCLETAVSQRLRVPARLSVRPPSIPPLRLGTLLLHQGTVTPGSLRDALDAQRLSGLKLGAQLRAMGILQPLDLLRGLAAQGGVGYLTHVDVSCVREAPGNLSPHALRALGVVPVDADAEARRLRVACLAPVPRTALGALYELTGWSVEPLLVSDEHLEPLMAAYGVARDADRPVVETHTETTLARATERVARAAEEAGEVRIRQTRFEPYLWVRLESDDRIEDVLCAESLGGESCLAAPTLP
ncbi:MAG: hypothetical protein AB1635_08865 [Acidobacteriota bacterium]